MTDLTSPVPTSAPRAASPRTPIVGLTVDRRRGLQLILAGIWLFDGILQFQPFMFTKNFAAMIIYPTISSNPSVVASPMSWAQRIITDHPIGTNTAFACIQLALGLAIAWRPTVKLGLAASVPWALAVWWFGEGFGGVLDGSASPLTGAPGGVILYALLAVLLWPSRRDVPTGHAETEAAAFVGAHAARALWLILWASLAYFALQPANTGSGAISQQISGMVTGQPRWLASIMNHAASLAAGRGLAISIVLAVILSAIPVSVYLPWIRARRTLLVVAIGTATVIWVVSEALGGLFTGMGTDPNTGPLLALLALVYWPTSAKPGSADAQLALASLSGGVS